MFTMKNAVSPVGTTLVVCHELGETDLVFVSKDGTVKVARTLQGHRGKDFVEVKSLDDSINYIRSAMSQIIDMVNEEKGRVNRGFDLFNEIVDFTSHCI